MLTITTRKMFLSLHSEALFSHGICPSCFNDLQEGVKKRGAQDPEK